MPPATSDKPNASGARAFWAAGSAREIAPFLAVAYGFAWLLWGYWVVAMPPGGLVISPAFIVCAIVGGLAPSLAAIVVTAAGAGRGGVTTLLATLRRPVAPPYAVFALLAVPVATLVSVTIQHLAGLRLQWPEPSLLAMAVVWPVMAALGEEFGWRAFVTARLLPTLGLVRTGLVVGLLWGLWHLPADYVGLKGYGDWFWLAFAINGPIVLTAHAMIMTWLWQKTGGALLAALIYHWSITASAIAAPSATGQGWQGLASAGIGAMVMWGIAGWLIARERRSSRAEARATS